MSTARNVSSRSGVLSRALVLLDLLATRREGVGVREAARETGIDRSAVGRIYAHLEQLGYAEQRDSRGQYVVGSRLFSVAATLHEKDPLVAAGAPFLERLVKQFNETCYLAARDGNSVVFRSKLDCDHTIRYVLELGVPIFLVGGASGFAVMSAMTDEELDELFTEPLPVYTNSSFSDVREIRRQIAIDREMGYSCSMGRWVTGGAGVAAPFHDASGRCAGAITLSAPISRAMELDVGNIGAAVSDAARGISERLGHRPAAR